MFKPGFLVRITAICLFVFVVSCEKKAGKVDVKTLMEARCSACHFSTNIYAVVKTPEQWEVTVERMSQINPDLLSPEERELIIAYLKTEVSKKQLAGH